MKCSLYGLRECDLGFSFIKEWEKNAYEWRTSSNECISDLSELKEK